MVIVILERSFFLYINYCNINNIWCNFSTKGVVIGDKVSVFGDLLGQCKRGWNKEYEGKKYFVGNGLLLQNRQDLFSVGVPKYIIAIIIVY
jgi:hypothetical protein